MKYCYIAFIICISACKQKDTSNGDSLNKKVSLKSNIPPLRNTINKKPVASFLKPTGDPRLHRKFGVEIYETPFTFKYLLEMHYDGMRQTDTLKVPDFGSWPIVKVKAGAEKLSCIIGFLDKEGKFREYKMLSAKDDNLKLTVLRSYLVHDY